MRKHKWRTVGPLKVYKVGRQVRALNPGSLVEVCDLNHQAPCSGPHAGPWDPSLSLGPMEETAYEWVVTTVCQGSVEAGQGGCAGETVHRVGGGR